MKKRIKIIKFLSLILFLPSCGGGSEIGKVLRNEKIKNTDEFLVKKRQPLTLPPDFSTIPKPGSISKKKGENREEIEKMLKLPKEQSSQTKQPSSIEDSIINQINK